jgi:hypothetical protein
MNKLIEIRCQNKFTDGRKCDAFLCKTSGDVEIVCRRCGCKNVYDSSTGKQKIYPKKISYERNTSSGMVFR